MWEAIYPCPLMGGQHHSIGYCIFSMDMTYWWTEFFLLQKEQFTLRNKYCWTKSDNTKRASTDIIISHERFEWRRIRVATRQIATGSLHCRNGFWEANIGLPPAISYKRDGLWRGVSLVIKDIIDRNSWLKIIQNIISAVLQGKHFGAHRAPRQLPWGVGKIYQEQDAEAFSKDDKDDEESLYSSNEESSDDGKMSEDVRQFLISDF